jgi:hypothetical protein
VSTAQGRQMPLDLEPVPDGNVVVVAGVAQVFAPLELAILAPGTVRRRSHFSTCPNADRFRKVRPATPGGRGRK